MFLQTNQIDRINVQNKKIKMKVVINQEDKNSIYRLRYNVHIEELQEPLITANYEYKIIKDEFDYSAIHIGAFINNRAVGAGRLNLIEQQNIKDLDIFELNRFGSYNLEELIIASKIIIERNFRSNGLFSTLMQNMYMLALMQDSKVALACVPIRFVEMFSKYGFLEYKGSCLHPELGQVVPMYLDLQNYEILQSIDSPFLSIYEMFKNNAEMEYVL